MYHTCSLHWLLMRWVSLSQVITDISHRGPPVSLKKNKLTAMVKMPPKIPLKGQPVMYVICQLPNSKLRILCNCYCHIRGMSSTEFLFWETFLERKERESVHRWRSLAQISVVVQHVTVRHFILGCSSANTNSNRMLRLAMLMHTSSKFHCDCPCCDIQLLCQPPRYTVHAETHYADADAWHAVSKHAYTI